MTQLNRIAAVVVEDSRLAREGLIEMLQEFPSIDVVGDAEHPDSAWDIIRQLRPKVLFLDIHMPGETGFGLLARLDYEPLVVFTTAYSEYAIRSFEFQTLDYLLKPISKVRLAQAIRKLESHVAGSIDVQTQEKMRAKNRVLIKDKDDCHLVTLSDVDYFESCKNYVKLFFDEKSVFVKKSLNQIEERVPENSFFRCSRQYIINLGAIKEIEEWLNDGFMVTLKGGKKIEISRRNAIKLKSMLSF